MITQIWDSFNWFRRQFYNWFFWHQYNFEKNQVDLKTPIQHFLMFLKELFENLRVNPLLSNACCECTNTFPKYSQTQL